MKTKFIVVSGIVAAVAVIGTFTGRSVWDRRHQLVSLHVRNAPLGEVIQKLERQTGQKIAVDRKLDRLVTLDMTRKPLAAVLDRVGEQCGASWRTVHAVYGSASALPALESSLYGDKKLDEAGWKLIAPGALNGFPMDLPDRRQVVLTNLGPAGLMQAAGGGGGPARVIVKHGADGSAPQVVTEGNAAGLPPGATIATEDATLAIGTNGSGAGTVRMKKQAAPAIVRMVRKKGDGAGGTAVEEEIWTPVEIVLESRLSEQLSNFSGAPTLEAALEAAKEVKGKVKTYYALRKSPFAMGMPGMSFNSGTSGGGRMVKSGGGTVPGGRPGGTNVFKMGKMPSTGELEAMVAQRRNDELGKLTPEQRVQRARDRQQAAHNQ